jgi:hypothetical protein
VSEDYGLTIFPQHAQLLAASAISPEVARERGYVSVDTKKRLESAGFANSQRSQPGLLIPIHGTDGQIRLHQYRPDEPRIDKLGRPRKYETPFRHQLCLDVPPRIRAQLADATVPLWITEGARKADAAVTAGLCCIALLGVEAWQANGVAFPDWRDVRLKDREVLIAFDSDVMTKQGVRGALNRLTTWLAYRGADVRHVILPSGEDDAKVGLDDYLTAGGSIDALVEGAVSQIVTPAPAAKESATSATAATIPWDGDLAGLLDDLRAFLGRFIAYPSSHAHVAHTLWCAHTHQMDAWESTPRIAFLSPEPGSGKTRALEVSELLVPRPVEAVNTTPAYLFRKVSSPDGLPTILYDEIDTLFGPKAKDNEEIRGMLNAGHRRGAVAGRCVTRGDIIETEELPAYCALALAGLGGLPDTLLTRAVVVRMKRRAPGEKVEPFRHRVHKDQGHTLRDRLAAWAAATPLGGAWPDMPAGIEDRAADVWEALLMVADGAAGDWPKLAREAAVALVADAKAATPSLGIRLLSDLRDVWDGTDGMHTEAILGRLNGLDEAPWGDLRGKPLDPRKLSRFLRDYDVKPRDVRADVDGQEKVRKGYTRGDLHDAWQRYLTARETPFCTICGQPLDQALIDAGFTTHAEEAGR